MTVRDEILEEITKHFNEPILIGGDLVRLIGFAEDPDDYYYICQHFGGKLVYNSCVGGLIPLDRLRGQSFHAGHNGEHWDDYYRLDSVLELNGSPKVETLIMKVLDHD